MNKHLDLERGCADNLFDLLSGALAGEHHPREAELFQPADALGVVDRHLGGRIQPQAGTAAPQQSGSAQVLYDRRIHARLAGGAGDLHQHGELLLQQDDIQRQIDLQTPDMTVLDRLRKVLACKICRIAAGVEHVNPEIDRVRTAGRRRAQALRTPSRGKYLDPAHAFGFLAAELAAQVGIFPPDLVQLDPRLGRIFEIFGNLRAHPVGVFLAAFVGVDIVDRAEHHDVVERDRAVFIAYLANRPVQLIRQLLYILLRLYGIDRIVHPVDGDSYAVDPIHPVCSSIALFAEGAA